MVLFLFWACNPVTLDSKNTSLCECEASDTGVEEEDTGELEEIEPSGEPEEEPVEEPEEDQIWDEATLEILSPQPAEFIELGTETLFEAVILDTEGNSLDFTEIEWSSSEDVSWEAMGDSFYDLLDVGQHAITAQAHLPNGDRLSYVVGGVLVQHPNAGVYSGTTSIDVTINNSTPIVVSCSGGVTVTINAAGEIGTGEGDCIVNINGNDIPSTYFFDLEIEDNTVGGVAILDLWLIQQSFPIEGTVENGELNASWSDSVLGNYIGVDGVLNLSRVSLHQSQRLPQDNQISTSQRPNPKMETRY